MASMASPKDAGGVHRHAFARVYPKNEATHADLGQQHQGGWQQRQGTVGDTQPAPVLPVTTPRQTAGRGERAQGLVLGARRQGLQRTQSHLRDGVNGVQQATAACDVRVARRCRTRAIFRQGRRNKPGGVLAAYAAEQQWLGERRPMRMVQPAAPVCSQTGSDAVDCTHHLHTRGRVGTRIFSGAFLMWAWGSSRGRQPRSDIANRGVRTHIATNISVLMA